MPCETADVFPASPRQCALQCRVVKKSRPTRFSSILGGGIRSPAGRSQTSWHTEDLAQPIQLFACRSRLLPDIAAELPFSSLAYTVEKATHLFGGATMTFVLQPWQLCLVILASWINREQQAVIEYLMTENRVLKEKLGNERILLNDDQRRRLAVKGKILGRKLLREFGTLFTPDTILRWHRQLVAKK